MALHQRRTKKLILFDLDGVIIDSRANMDVAWSHVQSELGISVPFSRYFAEIGRPFQDIMSRIGLADQGKRIEAVYRRASSQHLPEAPIFDGIEPFLTDAMGAGAKLGIVTSKDRARTQLVLDRLPVNFVVVMTPNDTLRGKPAPDPLLYAMAICNTDPEETIFIGDMASDAEAARRARIDYAHALWGYGDAPAACEVAAASPAELKTFLFG